MKIILAVTGCIAAYKSALVLRLLQKKECEVFPVMTRSAREFLGPLTLEKLSGHRVVSDLFEDPSSEIEHIRLARSCDLLLVAPATANILAKFASGIADDFLSTLYLSANIPVCVAPAMNVEMWRHAATQDNLAVLRKRGVEVVEPEAGYQACGERGPGRLAAPETIANRAVSLLRPRSLSEQRVLVTAGPTIEDLDPVRYLSNRSSGKMGYAVAREAVRRGAEVVLVSGPTALEDPLGARTIRVRSAAEMAEKVRQLFNSVDVVVKAAAVSDFRPSERAARKLKKGEASRALTLAPTEDILAFLGKQKREQLLVGFAAESEDLKENAARKLREKNLDLIVANDILSSQTGFGSDDNEVRLLFADGRDESWPRMSKAELADRLWDEIEKLLRARREIETVPGKVKT